MNQLSKILRELRGADSLYEVEKQTGIRRAQLQRYENGLRTPPRDILKKLSGYYEIAYETLLHLYLDEHFGDPEARTLAGWQKRGGYEALRQALGMAPNEVVDVVKNSGLRGRGGAGFPTGVKWSFMPKEKKGPHYLVVNADESEPGAFKDRELLRWTPHQLLEGCFIGAYAIRAEHIYIYSRGEFFEPAQIVGKAIAEAYEGGILGEKVRYDLRRRMFEHLQDLSLSYYSRTPVGWIMARV